MSQGMRNEHPCPGTQEILLDLIDKDLLGLLPDDRLWKLYCFRQAGHASRLRHRIYTKQKANGRLELVTFAAHNPPQEDGVTGGRDDAPTVRSALARVPDLSTGDLDRLIRAMRTQTPADEYDEIDLSIYPSLDEQLAWLRAQGNV